MPIMTHAPTTPDLTARQRREEMIRLAYISRGSYSYWSTAKDDAAQMSPLGPTEFDARWAELGDALAKRDALKNGKLAWQDVAPHVRGKSEEECEDLARQHVAAKVDRALDALTGTAESGR